MRVLYINNDGGDFADYIEVQEGKTVEQFFKDKMPAEVSTDYLIPRYHSLRRTHTVHAGIIHRTASGTPLA